MAKRSKHKQSRQNGQNRQGKVRKQSLQSTISDTDPLPPLFPNLPITNEGIQSWREQVINWMRKQVQQLEQLLLQYNSFDVIANVCFSQLSMDPETYREETHGGLAAIVEYVALLYLKHPYQEGKIHVVDARILNPVETKVHEILIGIIYYYLSETWGKENTSVRAADFDSIRHRTLLDGILVRSPGYPHHQKERLRALFTVVDDFLLNTVNFMVDDALQVEETFAQLVDNRLIEQRREALLREQELRKAVRLRRAGKTNTKTNTTNVDEEVVDLFAGLPGKEAKRRIRSLAVGWIFNTLGTTVFAVTAEEIAAETGIPVTRVRAVLDFFAVGFGEVPADFFMLSPTHVLTLRPLVRHEARFLYITPHAILWALRPRLEAVLKQASLTKENTAARVWEKYQEHRADYLERQTLHLLRLALPHSQVYRHLHYSAKTAGVKANAEIDALVIFDTTLFLIEMKAGEFTEPARRGGKERLKRDLQKLIADPHRQAVRAKQFLEERDSALFTLPDGQELSIKRRDFRRVILVAVSLESLDIHHANLHEAISAGVLDVPGIPWAVSLDVLQVICEHIEFPTQLIHYIQRRLRITEIAKFTAHDELDLFGNYLSEALYYEDIVPNDKSKYFLSFSGAFDDYYFYERGLRKTKTVKLRQKMPDVFHQIIMEIEAQSAAQGYSEALLQLLDWNDESRRKFVDLFELVRSLTRQDRRIHDASMVTDEGGGLGVTCFATLFENSDEAYERLCVYSHVKKYQQRAHSWLGLLTIVDRPGYVHAYITSGYIPWQYDQAMEETVQRLLGLDTQSK